MNPLALLHGLVTVLPRVKPNPLIGQHIARTFDPRGAKLPSWESLPHITQKRLPASPTDIRGIDSSGYKYIERGQLYRNLPSLLLNKFLILKFIPVSHHFSGLRKSNIAYTFTNYSSNVLNDEKLLQFFKQYKGPLSTLDFFKSVPMPMGTAVSRIHYRKFVKRSLFQALHELVPNNETAVQKVSGIFFFKFKNVATTVNEKDSLAADLRRAISLLVSDESFTAQLDRVVSKQNASAPGLLSIANEIKLENFMGSKLVPGYFPKLPYLEPPNPQAKVSGGKQKRPKKSKKKL